MPYIPRRRLAAITAIVIVLALGAASFFVFGAKGSSSSSTSTTSTTIASLQGNRYNAAAAAAISLTRQAQVEAQIHKHKVSAADISRVLKAVNGAIVAKQNLGSVDSDPNMIVYTAPGMGNPLITVCIDVVEKGIPHTVTCP